MENKSLQNLMAAFAGESQANRKYLAYAEQADREGYKAVAALFRAVAAAETIHAHSHLRIAGKIGDTRQNLKDAMEGEIYEFKSMYPEFIEIAEQEGDSKALRSFNFANQVEEVHAGLYKEAIETLDKNQEYVKFNVCPVCGYTTAQPPDKCPVCNVSGDKFIEIE
jgi:rubrerythrin